MAAKLAKTMRPEQIYLFGSYAWGNPRPESDIDLCLVFRELESNQVMPFVHMARDVLADFIFAKDIIVRSTKRMEDLRPYHAPLESKILRNGRLLYDATQ